MVKKSSTYLSPQCVTVDITIEGMLCASHMSTNFFIEDFTKVDGSWD